MTATIRDISLPHCNCSSITPHQQYGVLPWRESREGDLRILLITERNQPGWGVPKGWPAEGRMPLMSAALNAFDEAGIIGDIDPKPLTDYHYSVPDRNGAGYPRCVTLFAMRVRGTLLHWKEQSERQRRWFGIDEAATRLQNAELAGFVHSLGQRLPLSLTQATGYLPTLAG